MNMYGRDCPPHSWTVVSIHRWAGKEGRWQGGRGGGREGMYIDLLCVFMRECRCVLSEKCSDFLFSPLSLSLLAAAL